VSTRIDVQHLRILVVDDHEVVRSLLRHVLEAESGWEVCGEASNGDEAVERSRTLHPDIVVMDAVMPGRNGFDATREIVRSTPEMPVVITTLYEYPEVLRQAQRSGALGCVGKSKTTSLLIPAVKSAIDHQPFFPPLS
jgi:DNA-binding NarL/FixJ family response regulator